MKNLIKLATAIAVLFSTICIAQSYVNDNAEDLLSIANSQSTTNKIRLKICTTISCCGIGSIGIEIWSDKECHYIVTNKNGGSNIVVLNLKESTLRSAPTTDLSSMKTIKIDSDQILYDPSKTLGNDRAFAMKAGEYKIIDGQVAFEPAIISARSICWVETHQGHIFGHEYSYSYAFCVKIPFSKSATNNSGRLLTIDISQNKELINLAMNNSGYLSFDEDWMLTDYASASKTSEKIVIKAGRYYVNEDGIIQIRNFSTSTK